MSVEGQSSEEKRLLLKALQAYGHRLGKGFLAREGTLSRSGQGPLMSAG